MWLREAVAQHFKPRPRARNPRPQFRLSLDSVRSFVSISPEREAVNDAEPRAFLEVFLEETQNFLDTEFAKAYKLEQGHVDAIEFQAQIDQLPDDESVTPKFTCSDLVETTCDDPCDWHTAFDVTHDFSEEVVPNASMQRVFVQAAAADDTDDFVHTTQFFSCLLYTSDAADE